MSKHQITELLDAVRGGDKKAGEQLFPTMYHELRQLARYQMNSENTGHTLQATALVHEAYVKVLGDNRVPQDRAHFLAISAQAMRRILVDHARAKKSEKRGGELIQVTLNDCDLPQTENNAGLLELHDALTQLAEFDPRAAQAVEMKFFGGMTYEEIAESLGIGRSAAYEDIKAAKAWLAAQLAD